MSMVSEISDVYTNLIEMAKQSGEEVSEEAMSTYEQLKILTSGTATPEMISTMLLGFKQELDEIERKMDKEEYVECKVAAASLVHDVIPVVNKRTMTGGFVTSDKIEAMGGMPGVMAFLAEYGFKRLVTKEDFLYASNEMKAFNVVLFGLDMKLSERYAIAGSYLSAPKGTSEERITKALFNTFDSYIQRDHDIEVATRWATDVREESLEEALKALQSPSEFSSKNFDFFEYGSNIYLPEQYKDHASDRDFSAVPKTGNAELVATLNDITGLEVKASYPTKFGKVAVVNDGSKTKLEFIQSTAKEAHNKQYKTLCLKKVLEDKHIAKVVVFTAKRLRSLGLSNAANGGISTWAIHNMTLGAMLNLGYIRHKGKISPEQAWLFATEKLKHHHATRVVNNICAYLATEISKSNVALGVAASTKFNTDLAASHALRSGHSILYVADFYPDENKPNLTSNLTNNGMARFIEILNHATDCIGNCKIGTTNWNSVTDILAKTMPPEGMYNSIKDVTILKSSYLANGSNYYIAHIPVSDYDWVYGISTTKKVAQQIALYYVDNPNKFPSKEYMVHESHNLCANYSKATILDYILSLKSDPMIIETDFGLSVVACANVSTISDEVAKTMRPITYKDILAITRQSIYGDGDTMECIDTIRTAISIDYQTKSKAHKGLSSQDLLRHDAMTSEDILTNQALRLAFQNVN